MIFPETHIPITEIPLQNSDVRLFIKREDLIHPEISGNKYWKLFYNINRYMAQKPANPRLITFGGAFSNHIAAVSALGYREGIPTVGIIRGDELANKWQHNPTLSFAAAKGMMFCFVSREQYRRKEELGEIMLQQYPEALIIPEGGTNKLAVDGIRHMLNEQTKSFDYLCCAVGTGGTLAGISKFAEAEQNILGFKIVNDDSLQQSVLALSGRNNFSLINEINGRYGKITDENIRFINVFAEKYGIQLDPVYTGKMMQGIFALIEADFFPKESKILSFHTGGLQGISGANKMLAAKGRKLINNTVSSQTNYL